MAARHLFGYIDGDWREPRIVAAHESTLEVLRASVDRHVRFDLQNDRNHKNAAMFHATIKEVFDHLPESVQANFITMEGFRKALTVAVGFYDVQMDFEGNMTKVAKSTSFSEMSEPEFRRLHQAVTDFIFDRLVPEWSKDGTKALFLRRIHIRYKRELLR